MATITKGYTFGATESVTNAKLHSLVESATITNIVNADIDSGALIAFSKLAQENIDASKLIGMENITDDGIIPIANIPTGTTANKVVKLDANAKLQVCSGLGANNGSEVINLNATNLGSGTVPTARLGSGTPSSANFLRGDSSWVNLAPVTQVNDTDAGTTYSENGGETTFLSVAKTITSGNTVLLLASGYVLNNSNHADTNHTIKLKNGSTVSQTMIVQSFAVSTKATWSCCAIVTGLSGSVTFSVTADTNDGSNNPNTAYGNLIVLEF